MEWISKYGVKIQVTVFAGLLVFIFTIALSVGGYIEQVDANTSFVNKHEIQLGKMPVLEDNIKTIKNDIETIKEDIKSLLKIR